MSACVFVSLALSCFPCPGTVLSAAPPASAACWRLRSKRFDGMLARNANTITHTCVCVCVCMRVCCASVCLRV